MKRFLSLLLSLFMLTSCAAHTPKRKIEEKDVKRMVYEAVEEERLILLDQEEIGFVLDIEPEDYSSAWVWQDRTAATIDEIGIFIAKTGMENALYQQIEGYLTACKNDKKEWLESYNPIEAAKLANGTLFRYGNCMGYAFLNPDELAELLEEMNDFYSAEE